MIAGIYLGSQVDNCGVTFHYRAAHKAERLNIFRGADPLATEIIFPYPLLDNAGNEYVSPSGEWDENLTLINGLDADELHLREHGFNLAEKFLVPGSVIYDPACSTGTYLGSLSRYFPNCNFIGSDRSFAMTQRAAEKIPRVFVADAGNAPIANGSIDLLILRFLNAEVMPRTIAGDLFIQLSNLVSPRGRIFMFGHTPLLLDVSSAAHAANLQIESQIGVEPRSAGIFQFYQLGRGAT
ncbi:class I SAM-dependent methyltransferase [Mycobacterium montefiorense]|uniref:Methyltransferase domain-containing protein n=1 Tax=Mycobacterium montefiorense TaxID=154654 RepID=A0AA37PMM4_9MYCO|nr:class I SAM-dependent methyltransferase [Mycobacterium montefiorense]GBG37200.1 hypothetical protein MmonteBS_15720 [Mycobacterium montefiorense]GKU34088.1 hypothetical protein NJB14191_14340 [Mycobacterium montefiorense]GKU39656.1 hypothetical protein NJB14192_16480 [Mycobacterium montefiorense]GKU47705.1 hypothetical protein NJB14194_43230 [Mycobacterium montefiorense]GKU51957.1 hypothetical protein NJB14195_32010 [Mycobacterium montefiorense]